jgi:polygalacturonase
MKFGAKGDNTTEDTLAVQRAINDSSCREIIFSSPGKYLLRAVTLRSNLTLTVAEGE